MAYTQSHLRSKYKLNGVHNGNETKEEKVLVNYPIYIILLFIHGLIMLNTVKLFYYEHLRDQ